RLSAKKAGYAESTQGIEVAGGDSQTVELRLVPESNTGGATKAGGSNVLPYVGFGLAGVGIAVGSTFGLLALSKRSTLDSACVNKQCPRSSQSNIDALSRDATISTVGFGVAVVGLGIGIYGAARGSPSPAPTSGSVHPTFGLGSAGLSGNF